jgi:hypothetical protein
MYTHSRMNLFINCPESLPWEQERKGKSILRNEINQEWFSGSFHSMHTSMLSMFMFHIQFNFCKILFSIHWILLQKYFPFMLFDCCCTNMLGLKKYKNLVLLLLLLLPFMRISFFFINCETEDEKVIWKNYIKSNRLRGSMVFIDGGVWRMEK